MYFLNLVLISLVALLGCGLFLILRDTLRGEGRWGINLKSVSCPRCSNEMPKARVPASQQQALWGGGTCARCNCEMDKWGVDISPDKVDACA